MNYKGNINKIVFTLLFCFLQLIAFAQEFTVTGKVTTNSGETLPGVSIAIKGTTRGTITDIDGNFTLNVPDETAIIVCSYVGYITEEIAVGTNKTIDIQMDEDLMQLSEVVVVGYGVTKKSDLTGAVSSVKEEDFNLMAAATPEQLIQGRVAGVQITSNNGEPGAGSQIRIRGASTIRSGQQPLYVIDGIPLDNSTSSPQGATAAGIGGPAASNPLNFLNSNDIESIDILKDASAAAIYGSRGANGVVLITTKKGKDGLSTVDYAFTYGISNLPKKLPVLSTEEWLAYRIDTLGYEIDDPSHLGNSIDWQDQIFRTANSQTHSLSFSGGTEKTMYRASFNYSDENGIIKKSNQKRYYGRINFSQNAIKDYLHFEANLTGSQILQSRPPIGTNGYEGDLLLNSLKANPTWPVYDSLGNFYQPDAIQRNPLAMLELTEDNTRTSRIIGGGSATLKIIEGLTFKVNLGIDYTNANRKTTQSQDLAYVAVQSGKGTIYTNEFINYIVENTLNYNKSFGNQSINLLAGYSYQNIDKSGYGMEAGGFTTDKIDYVNDMDAGTSADYRLVNSWAGTIEELQSYFGRVNYNLLEKYLITATIRADGSSKFGENNKYGYFPSLAFGWRMSQESFIQNLNVFSNLKLRMGWGQTGNSEISPDNSTFLLARDPASTAIINNVPVSGYKLDKTPQPDLKWETTTSTNIGVDWGVFGGRLSGTIDVFRKKTTDLLLQQPTKPLSPTPSFITNLENGYILNDGIEIGINSAVMVVSDFTWDINLNFTAIKNLAVDILEDDNSVISTGSIQGQGLTGAYAQAYANDQALATFYLYKIDSLSDRGQPVYIKNPGESGDSLMFMGSPLPKFTLGLTNTFRYKSFDFSFFIDVVYGNKIFNNTAILLEKTNLHQAQNALSDFAADDVSFRMTPKQSDRYLEDGSYIRLSNATFGYNFKLKALPWFKGGRVYVTGSNILLATKYTGFDPDVSSSADLNGVRSIGIDNTNYPKARTILFGLNVSF